MQEDFVAVGIAQAHEPADGRIDDRAGRFHPGGAETPDLGIQVIDLESRQSSLDRRGMLGVGRTDRERGVAQIVLEPGPAELVREAETQCALVERASTGEVTDGIKDKGK